MTRSNDHGDTWDSLGTRQPNNVTAVAFNRGGDIFLGLEANAILRSTDNGSSWQTRGDRSIPAGLTIRDLVINARGDLFASTFRGTGGSAMPALYRSTDSGATWAKVFDSVGIALLAIGPRDEIYFTSSGWSSPIYRSSDNGESFRKINPPSGYQDIFNAIAVDEQGHLFLGTRDNGILLSVDSGATWMAQNMGLPGRNAQLIATGPGDRVYIDVAGKLFRAETEMLSVDEGPATGGMALGAEPNPTRGETVIRFPLRSAAHVTLEIHDANGRLVASLSDGGLEAGEHAVIWEGAGNPSGVYTVTLRAGALLRSARLILLK